jgi:hypothetical protein
MSKIASSSAVLVRLTGGGSRRGLHPAREQPAFLTIELIQAAGMAPTIALGIFEHIQGEMR